MKKIYYAGLCLFLFLLSNNFSIQAQTYANLPFVETFNNTWINGNAVRDLPSIYWTTNPSTTDSSWSREDDGFARGAWTDNLGAYSPGDFRNMGHSARFHSYDAASGTSGTMDLHVDFSTLNGNKSLSFYYINVGGLDSLQVLVSQDGGNTFNKVTGQTIDNVWTLVTVNLGNLTSSNGVIRFMATSDFGYTDIGVDQVSIFSTGNTLPISNFGASVTKGLAPLTINFTDSSLNNPTAWQWIINGVVVSTNQNFSYNFTSPGSYTIQLIASKPGYYNDTLTKTRYIQLNGLATLPFSEHFDNEWVSLNDTLDVPDFYWTSNPGTGNQSWSREDEGSIHNWSYPDQGSYCSVGCGALGTSHSARFHSDYAPSDSTGTMDLHINFSTSPQNDTLSFYYINFDGYDSLSVYLSPDNGVTFNKLAKYGNSEGWGYRMIALGNVSSSKAILRFQATSDFGNTDIGMDEIFISGTNNQAKFLTYSLPNQDSSVIDTTNHTIAVTMPYGISLSALAASFTVSGGAATEIGTNLQVSSISTNNFNNNVVYTVISEDGTNTINWTVKVTVAPNTKDNFLTYSLPAETGSAVIDSSNYTIAVTMPYNSSISNLAATFTLSAGASASIGSVLQVSGTTVNNFTSDVVYTVTAQDGVTNNNWTVKVTVAQNDSTAILDYSLPGEVGTSSINKQNKTIDVTLAYGVTASDLTAAFKLSTGAYATVGSVTQTSGTTKNNFTSPVVYTVTAQDGVTTENWTVTVTNALNDRTNFLTYSLPNQEGNSVIDSSNQTVSVNLLVGSSVTSLVATFSLSTGATAAIGSTDQISGTTANNFTNSLTYVITAQDGVTKQNWTVTVNLVTAVPEATAINAISAYPNPSKGLYQISISSISDENGVILEVYNLEGIKLQQQITSFVAGSQIIPIDLSGYAKGVYTLIIRTKESVSQLKLLKD